MPSLPILLKIMDIATTTEDEFNKFITIYNDGSNNLCVNPKTNERTQSLLDTIDSNYKFAKKLTPNHVITYLYEDNKMLAFVVTYDKNNITDLDLVCGNRDKTKKYEGKSLGIYLLNFVYDKAVGNNNLLKIRPATDDLISYYTRWKTPDLPIEKFPINTTYGYLIYGDVENLITQDNIHTFLRTALFLPNFRQYIPSIDIDINTTPRDDVIRHIHAKIEDSKHDKCGKKQLQNLLEDIEFVNIKDFYEKLKPHLTEGGGKRKYRHTRKSKRKSKGKKSRKSNSKKSSRKSTSSRR